MRKYRFITMAICLSLMVIISVSCKSQQNVPALHCPFSDLTWDSTVANMVDLEGETNTTYKSVYGGLCYTYPKAYQNKSGTIKYMFDDKNHLMCIAWAYASDSEDELYTLYDTINQSVNDTYGESNYNTDKETNYGNVWYLEDGHITLSTMITSTNKALQYAYINPANNEK